MWDALDPRNDDTRDRDAADPRDADPIEPRDVFTQGLNLPRGLERERVHTHDHDYQLRGSESRALATIGAFRVVPADDLRDDLGRAGDVRHGDLERLREAGLIDTIAPLDRGDRTTLVTLTARGRDVLESHRSRASASSQTYYAGSVKSRELSHDAQVYRAYLRAAERRRGARAHLKRGGRDYERKSP
jgi:DNA-binding MarR family transcriptional regulator